VDEHTGGEFENTPNISARSSYGFRPATAASRFDDLLGPGADDAVGPTNSERGGRILRGRPPGWEDLLFAAVLLREKQALEPKFRDHELK
jgi:hypothetical protein